MSDKSRPATMPRLTVTLDEETARALGHASAARMQTRADFIRDAVRNELSIRQAAAEAIRREVERQGETARRLQRLCQAGPTAVSARVAADVARIGQSAKPPASPRCPASPTGE